MKKKLPKLIGLLVLIILGFSMNTIKSCSFFKKEKKNDNAVALPVFKVDTATVTLASNFLGAVEGKFDVEIRPQVEGELQKAYVDEGDYVEKGQRLFKIDPREYEEDLNRAIAKENVERAKLNNARTEVERLRPLVENKVMAPVRLETERSNYKVAEANLKQASAEVANARIELGYTTIKAPVRGYIGRIRKRIGNLVKASDTEPITVLTDVQEIYVYFSISESDFSEIQRVDSTDMETLPNGKRIFAARKVSLLLPDMTEYSEPGYIDATSGQVNRNTGTITMRASFPNKDNILRSGNTVTIVRYDKKRAAIMIPQRATYELQAKTFVQKLTPDSLSKRQLIEIESEAPNNQYIVKSGLKPGDQILVEGQDKVSDSVKIRPMPYHPDTLVAPGVESKIIIKSDSQE